MECDLDNPNQKAQNEYWDTHREQIYHLAEQWGISVALRLCELQRGVDAAISLFLQEAERRGL